MTQSSDAASSTSKASRFSLPKFDVVTIGAILGAVAAIYGLWWSRARIFSLEPSRGPEAAADQDAILLAVLFLLLGLCIALLVKKLANMEGDFPFVLIVFLPMVAFLVLSGKITNLNAGVTGVEFTLSVLKVPPVSKQSVGTGIAVIGTPPGPPAACAPKQFTSQAPQQELVASAPEPTVTVQGNPVYLTLKMGDCVYSMEDLAATIEENRYNDEFRFVVLLDSDDVFRAYMDSLTARELFSCRLYEADLETCVDWSYPAFEDAINNYSQYPDAIRGFPGIETNTISEGSTNIAALKEMQRQGLDALIVKDNSGHVTGVLKQDQILGTMMIELASPAPGP